MLLTHTQHTLHQVLVRWVNVGCLTQMALARFRFFSQQVAFKRFKPADLARTCYFKSLFSTGMSLHLWHGLNFGMAKVSELIEN